MTLAGCRARAAVDDGVAATARPAERGHTEGAERFHGAGLDGGGHADAGASSEVEGLDRMDGRCIGAASEELQGGGRGGGMEEARHGVLSSSEGGCKRKELSECKLTRNKKQ
jgi:hypothetical protein